MTLHTTRTTEEPREKNTTASSAPHRKVQSVVTAHRQSEGGGFIVRRPLPSQELPLLDPFLLIDEMGPVNYGPGEALGAPDHPHRGFETVTYLLQGEMEHKDSAGHEGVLRTGDVQWMTAGSGVVHSEMPSQKMMDHGGPMHGFQIWVNLPARLKLSVPRYQEVSQRDIPRARAQDGLAEVRIIAGQALGVRAVIDTHTPIVYHDWTIQPGGETSVEIDPAHNVGVYVYSGTLLLGPDRQPVQDGQMAVLTDGTSILMAVAPDEPIAARFLVLGGKPHGEPVARYGPFVMNTQEELHRAFDDYRNGRMGKIQS